MSQDSALRQRRHPTAVYDVGQEPGPRFSLANERTALAWMRTALAIVAGGVALASLPAWPTLGAAACCCGGITALRAVFGWRRVERALRQKRPLPAPHALLPLALGVGGVLVTVLSPAATSVPGWYDRWLSS